jgi:hypothetical protein
MSMPARSNARIMASLLQAGPIVQMIFERRKTPFLGVEFSSSF